MDEMINKINMWKQALEERNANLSIMQVFDSICVYLGEQQRKIDILENVKEQE